MAKEKQLLDRIKVIRSTHKITQAMKMVAVAKLEKTKKKLAALEAYVLPLLDLLPRVMPKKLPNSLRKYFVQRPEGCVLWILVTSDRGLCGSFNNIILKGVHSAYEAGLKAGKETRYIPIGNKGLAFCKRKGLPYIHAHLDMSQQANWEEVSAFSAYLLNEFKAGKYSKIMIRYPAESGSTRIHEEQLLPYLPIEVSRSQEADCIYEPRQADIAIKLLPHLQEMQLYRSILKAHVGEHKARMLAMNQATENAEELLKVLNLTYNRLRQATITRGILEVTAGLKRQN